MKGLFHIDETAFFYFIQFEFYNTQLPKGTSLEIYSK